MISLPSVRGDVVEMSRDLGTVFYPPGSSARRSFFAITFYSHFFSNIVQVQTDFEPIHIGFVAPTACYSSPGVLGAPTIALDGLCQSEGSISRVSL